MTCSTTITGFTVDHAGDPHQPRCLWGMCPAAISGTLRGAGSTLIGLSDRCDGEVPAWRQAGGWRTPGHTEHPGLETAAEPPIAARRTPSRRTSPSHRHRWRSRRSPMQRTASMLRHVPAKASGIKSVMKPGSTSADEDARISSRAATSNGFDVFIGQHVPGELQNTRS